MDRRKFLVHLGLFVGLCIATGVAIYLIHSDPPAVEALLRVEGPLAYAEDDLTAERLRMYRDTQATLMKSKFVLTAALRDNDINQLPAIRNLSKHPVESLSSMLEVTPGENGVMGVRIPLPWYGRGDVDQWRTILDGIVGAYMRESVAKEKIDAGDQLSKLRSRYNGIKQAIVMKTDDLASYQDSVSIGPNDDWRVGYMTRKAELFDARLLDLQLELLASEVRDNSTTEKVLLAKQIEVVTKARNDNLKALSGFVSTDGSVEVMKHEIATLKNDLATIRTEIRRFEVAIDGPDSVVVLQRAMPSFDLDAPSYAEIARSYEGE